MPTVKRRTLWISDDDWARIEERARERSVNVSELVRRVFSEQLRADKPRDWPDNSGVPFGAPRPAPKPGKRG